MYAPLMIISASVLGVGLLFTGIFNEIVFGILFILIGLIGLISGIFQPKREDLVKK